MWLTKLLPLVLLGSSNVAAQSEATRERLSMNAGWRFQRWTSNPDNLSYSTLKPWMMPFANKFVNSSKQVNRPSGQPPTSQYAAADLNDTTWEQLDLPHDWAIKGPFYVGNNVPVGGDQGRLPFQGIGWYRKTLSVSAQDLTKTLTLEVDGAMAYATVWVNGILVGGWPYGYASWSANLSPYLKSGDNQLAIRLDNPADSSRWYPGGGIYRNLWLTKTNPTHVDYAGTWISSKDVSTASATLDLVVQIENTASSAKEVQVVTEVYQADPSTGAPTTKVAQFPNSTVSVGVNKVKATAKVSVTVSNPKLWGPKPAQEPNLHVAITRLFSEGQEIDRYQTKFGIRSLRYAGDGLYVNGQRTYLKGVCQHHDLGSLGTAFNIVAAERQLQMLVDMGSNAIRTSHNPPAPEILELADSMGILILDEIFDTWNTHKTRNDFQTIFADWSEPDLRSFVRRDRNHPSVWAWSFGNEIAEQGQGASGAAAAQRLRDIIREEDTTRKTTVGMNTASADGAFTGIVDLIGLNYQGEGMGGGNPNFNNFRGKYPDKMIFSTESSSVLSSRGTYLFPVSNASNVVINSNGPGADPNTRQISSYDLYAVSWGASPDHVFSSQDKTPYVGGEFVWTGWDYIGEPTPYELSRSSYFGIISLDGQPKDRFYLYQSRWNPDVRSAHILPHWNWPDRVGQVTPVHVHSSGDEAELFINNKSQGRQKRGQYQYRFRWSQVKYEAGEVRVVVYKGGQEWATASVRTTGDATQLQAETYRNRTTIAADGVDLSFVSVAVADSKGDFVATAEPTVTFSVEGPGEIVSTDNGDPTDMVAFPSKSRKAFRGRALAIVRAKRGATGQIVVTAQAGNLTAATVTLSIS